MHKFIVCGRLEIFLLDFDSNRTELYVKFTTHTNRNYEQKFYNTKKMQNQFIKIYISVHVVKIFSFSNSFAVKLVLEVSFLTPNTLQKELLTYILVCVLLSSIN